MNVHIHSPDVQGVTLQPGSLVLRPTRSDAEQNEDAFHELLELVRDTSTLPLKKIAEAQGDTSPHAEQNVSKRIKTRTFNQAARNVILKYLFEDKNLLLGSVRTQLRHHPDAFYFSFLNFMGTRETSQDNARAAAVGTYRLWRFSVEHEDEFVLGRLDVFEDEHSRALKVRMIQPKRTQHGVRGSFEQLEGYFMRIADMYAMILHDRRNEELRISLFSKYKMDEVGVGSEAEPGDPRSIFAGRRRHLVHLDGFGLGIDGRTGFFSPVHLSLVDDVDELAALDEQLDVLPEDDPRIPPRIAKKLKRNGPLRRL